MEDYIGTIILFAGNFAPRNWKFCYGQLLSINENPSLYSILGTTYGGDGQNKFALPDLRGRVPVGTGTGPGLTQINSGNQGGNEYTTLTVKNLPSHSHTVCCDSNPSRRSLANSPEDNFPATFTAAEGYSSASDSTMNSEMLSAVGDGKSFSNRQPFLGLNYIICVNGLYPPRD